MRRLASIAELISLKIMKAWPLILILRLAMILMTWHLHRLFTRIIRRCWTEHLSFHRWALSHLNWICILCCWERFRCSFILPTRFEGLGSEGGEGWEDSSLFKRVLYFIDKIRSLIMVLLIKCLMIDISLKRKKMWLI